MELSLAWLPGRPEERHLWKHSLQKVPGLWRDRYHAAGAWRQLLPCSPYFRAMRARKEEKNDVQRQAAGPCLRLDVRKGGSIPGAVEQDGGDERAAEGNWRAGKTEHGVTWRLSVIASWTCRVVSAMTCPFASARIL